MTGWFLAVPQALKESNLELTMMTKALKQQVELSAVREQELQQQLAAAEEQRRELLAEAEARRQADLAAADARRQAEATAAAEALAAAQREAAALGTQLAEARKSYALVANAPAVEELLAKVGRGGWW